MDQWCLKTLPFNLVRDILLMYLVQNTSTQVLNVNEKTVNRVKISDQMIISYRQGPVFFSFCFILVSLSSCWCVWFSPCLYCCSQLCSKLFPLMETVHYMQCVHHFVVCLNSQWIIPFTIQCTVKYHNAQQISVYIQCTPHFTPVYHNAMWSYIFEEEVVVRKPVGFFLFQLACQLIELVGELIKDILINA